MPNPKTEITQEINNAYLEANVNLNALLTGDDPFAGGKQTQQGYNDAPLPADNYFNS